MREALVPTVTQRWGTPKRLQAADSLTALTDASQLRLGYRAAAPARDSGDQIHQGPPDARD